MESVERFMVFDFNTYTAFQVDMVQIVASKERWPGDLLPETLNEFGFSMLFPPLSSLEEHYANR